MEVKREDTDEKLFAVLELLHAWLARSGGFPLSLSLIGTEISFQHSLRQQFFQTAVLYCKRWEHVEIRMPFTSLPLICPEMPLLRDLAFGLARPLGPEDAPTSPLELFYRAPQLKRLTLTRHFPKFAVRLPWAQITHLVAISMHPADVLNILHDATHLAHCELSTLWRFQHPVALAAHPRPHEHLRSLVFRTNSYHDTTVIRLLNNLTLPALRTLEVSTPVRDLLKALKSFISRSHCALEELRFNREPAEGVRAYREAFPAIRTIAAGRQTV
jgi:hypothetical protein